MSTPEYIHFFSWASRVSIELPVGFEEEVEDPDTGSVIYGDDLDEGDEPGARVMTKATAVPEGTDDAFRSIAAVSANIRHRRIEHQESCLLDGAPGVRQILSYFDEDAGIDLIRHETFVQLSNVVFSITCLAPASRRSGYLDSFDHASRTARFILLPVQGGAHEGSPELDGGMASYAHLGVRISALVPPTWSVSEVAEHHLRFFAPPHQEHQGYQPTFSISLGEPEGFGPEGFQDFFDAALERLKLEIPGFQLRRVEQFSLSSFLDINALWYNSSYESGLEFVQLQGLGLLDRYNLYLINAATLKPLADLYLPRFEEILKSLRVLPNP